MNNPPTPCSVQALHRRLEAGDAPFLLDVREPDEVAYCALPGIVNLPLSTFVQRADELEPHREAEIVVICHHGVRSEMARAWLSQHGFTGARNLVVGMHAWSTEVDPSVPTY
jgi:rhodanese-related sulfurtransferase